MRLRTALLLIAAIAPLASASAQRGGAVGGVIGGVTGTAGNVTGALRGLAAPLDDTLGNTADRVTRLASARIERLATIVRRNADVIELDLEGNPARKGELVLLDPDPQQVETARGAGFEPLGEERLADLDLRVVRLRIPANQSLRKAQAKLAKLLPGAEVSADTLLFQSGRAGTAQAGSAPGSRPIGTKVGVIDGAPGRALSVAQQRGFAQGAPVGSNHGSAVVSLLQLAGVRQIAVADVYGTDRAGGNTLAVVRALDWLSGTGARVVSISLVGPASPVLARAIAAAQRKGIVIVAAVGNDGPAAPPAFPASYPGVIAVTAVDGRDRPLIEAGKALHLDYAAPGADMLAAAADGRWMRVRGTSFATPLVAARAAAAMGSGLAVVPTLDHEARRPSRALAYGRGILCGDCRRTR